MDSAPCIALRSVKILHVDQPKLLDLHADREGSGLPTSITWRVEQLGLPYTPVGKRSKRYDLAEFKAWLRANYGEHGAIPAPTRPAIWKPSDEFMRAVAKVKLRTVRS